MSSPSTVFLQYIFDYTFTLRSFASEQFRTERAAHNLVKLLRNKLVSLDLANLILALANGSLASEPGGTLADSDILDYCHENGHVSFLFIKVTQDLSLFARASCFYAYQS